MSTAVRSVELFHVAVPLRKPIRHASHERVSSDNLVVRVQLESGQVGYGEGVPRPYVTGESIETTFEHLGAFDAAKHFGRPRDFAEALHSAERLTLPSIENDPRGMFGNAARCALELAALDAYGRQFGVSVRDAIRAVEAPGLRLARDPHPVRYSGAITAESPRKERVSAWKMRIWGFQQVKLKVGVDGQDDPARLARLRRILGRRMDIRLDANEAWSADAVVERVRPLLAFKPSALEQPVPHAQVEALSTLRPTLGIPVMLDESLCGEPDARLAIERGTADLLNVRLSKCGGLVPSLRIMALAWRSGLGVQLGCHPGETGLLSAAGRHVATNLDGIRYLEGSYDRHILTENLTIQDPTFGYGGRARPLDGPGLGVEVDPRALARMVVKSQELSYG